METFFRIIIVIIIAVLIISVGYLTFHDFNSPESKAERARELAIKESQNAEYLIDGKAHFMTELNGKKYFVKYIGWNNGERTYSVIPVAENNGAEK